MTVFDLFTLERVLAGVVAGEPLPVELALDALAVVQGELAAALDDCDHMNFLLVRAENSRE